MQHSFKKLLDYRPVRFVIAGGLAAVFHIGAVYLLTHVLDVWYLISTTIGFLSAVAVSFLLQKFFAYRDHRTNVLPVQTSTFFIVAVVNLTLNNFIIYLFVEYVHLVPLIAQLITSSFIAVWSYIIYSFIFTDTASEQDRQVPLEASKEHLKE